MRRVQQAGGPRASDRLLRRHQVPDGPRHDAHEGGRRPVPDTGSLHTRHPSDSLQRQGLQPAVAEGCQREDNCSRSQRDGGSRRVTCISLQGGVGL